MEAVRAFSAWNHLFGDVPISWHVARYRALHPFRLSPDVPVLSDFFLYDVDQRMYFLIGTF